MRALGTRLVVASTLAASLLVAPTLAAQDRPRAALFAEPDPSPDGREIAFVSGGDIWVVAVTGGEARLLVAHEANDYRPRWSPDGTQLAFVSTRSGNGDLYVLDLATNVVRRVTYDDGAEQLDAWSPDGQWLYFSSSSQDIAGMQDVFRVRTSGGTPARIAGDRYASEYWAAPAPDGRRLAITARGTTSGQWWRHGSSHIDEAEIWTVSLDATPVYARVSTGERPGKGRDVWPMWTPDGQSLVYMSDRGGVENLYRQRIGAADREAVTRFTDGRVLWPRMSRDGSTVYFERDFQVWAAKFDGSAPAPVAITLRGSATRPQGERLSLTTGVQEFALSPDAKKLAVIVRGELFAADAKEGGEATRLSTNVVPEGMPAWAPDSRRLVFTAWRGEKAGLFVYDVAARSERTLTPGGDDVNPLWSPDGKLVAFVRDGRELRVVDVASGVERVLATGRQLGRVPFLPERNFAFSPDGSHLAYLDITERGFLNAFVVPVAGGASRQVSFLSNAFGGTVSWSADGRSLFFTNSQRTESSQVIRVDLVPRGPSFREARFDALFTRDSAAAGTVRIDTVGLRRRATAMPINLSVGSLAVSPDGKTLAMIGTAAGQTQLWTWPLEEGGSEAPQLRQVTSTAGGKGNLRWSPDSKELWFLSGGRVQAIGVENRQQRGVNITATLTADFSAERAEVFRQVWGWTAENFYDAEMHGVDWPALRRHYAPIVAASQTPEELRRALGLMIGELNASHTGVGGPSAEGPSTGRLGVDFDRASIERDGTLRIAAIIPRGPVALAGDIAVGDIIIAVNETMLRNANIDSLLAHTAGRRVTLRVRNASDARSSRLVTVQPVSTGAEKSLRYDAWVEERRAYVAKASNGRLGYVHMIDMGEGSLRQLYVDLDAENIGRDGVVIDIRNNNGGFVNAYALDVFARRPYITMERRGTGVEASARLQLGQRAYEKPTVLVTNQHSLSDAEDFTEGYRALGLGPVIGEPTSGWIIYTSNVTLFEGTTLRIPFIRIRDAEGKDMELFPRPVDVRVDRPVGEEYRGVDSQLDAAVRALLDRLR
ncbi:MAG: peptidase S41 [Gemmatimonas sp.]|nr:peptidase S41 [Gemmatimonas sp.]